ncbi:MAG: PilT/PilU family type 4a pilus ATPase [Planctomycetota bacterium]|nr:MAG: PilT/PilU family type 4a pilus ATPase [Planctomycetota bacterium]
MDMQRLLRASVQFKASDLHVQAGSPPTVRVDGTMIAFNAPPVTAEDVRGLIAEVATEAHLDRLERDRSCDFAYAIPDLARFRINAFYEKDGLAFVARTIPPRIKTFADLSLPPVLHEIAEEPRGLVLVTGTTGSGKSTTLAAMVDHLNRTRRLRIITIEDPIEFFHESQKSLVAQRELGRDTPTFTDSLRRVLRQDPDVILVGELRDAETMRTALQAADTGHIVFSTVHTTNASFTMQRIVAMFPPDERELLLTELATNLVAVVSQRLATHKQKEKGRIPVVEIMRNTAVVSKAILEGRITSLPQAIANRDNGMQLFDQHLVELYNTGQISGTEALRLSTNPDAVALALRGMTTLDTSGGLVT